MEMMIFTTTVVFFCTHLLTNNTWKNFAFLLDFIKSFHQLHKIISVSFFTCFFIHLSFIIKFNYFMLIIFRYCSIFFFAIVVSALVFISSSKNLWFGDFFFWNKLVIVQELGKTLFLPWVLKWILSLTDWNFLSFS